MEPNTILAVMKLLGVGFALLGVMVGITHGWKALKMTGGGIVEITVKYLLTAAILYLISSFLEFTGFARDNVAVTVMGAFVMFGIGICFFMIFWKIAKHLEEIEKMVED